MDYIVEICKLFVFRGFRQHHGDKMVEAEEIIWLDFFIHANLNQQTGGIGVEMESCTDMAAAPRTRWVGIGDDEKMLVLFDF